MDKIRVLQLGTEDWSGIYELSEGVDWTFSETVRELPEDPYDAVLLDRTPRKSEMDLLRKAVKAYTLFVTERVNLHGEMRSFFEDKQGRVLKKEELPEFLRKELAFFYSMSYGEKFRNTFLEAAQDFNGTLFWNGNYYLNLQGDFGEQFYQIAYWKNNIPILHGQTLDLWLEYEKTDGVEIAMTVTLFERGSVSKVVHQWEYDETALQDIVQLHNEWMDSVLFVSLSARGRGDLKIIALHDRFSRGKYGFFLPGGQRLVTSGREEIFYYFDPGDRKPPLNVYFSGYKTAEGFEGYNLMRRLGCPFLLIAEARLEGGAFYLGSAEYEDMLLNVIETYRWRLRFSMQQVIFSGLSMGTFGALYYGCEMSPYALLLGKPLVSLGNVAVNETLNRPGGFPTSLDVLLKNCGGTETEDALAFNARFWERFDRAYWKKTRFILSYMIEDDYDSDAYETLLSHLQEDGVQVYGKGIHGRHNDKTGEIVRWFIGQYEKILREDFGRKLEK